MLSSSVEVPSPGGLSGLSAAARNVVRSSSISGAMYSLEKSPGSGGADSASLAGNKKRRSSLGAKMVAIVGLSQWSKSTQQLNQQGQSVSQRRSQLQLSGKLSPTFFVLSHHHFQYQLICKGFDLLLEIYFETKTQITNLNYPVDFVFFLIIYLIIYLSFIYFYHFLFFF